MVGNIANFTKTDILRCFLRFGKNVGRQELSKDLELGEGTVRTMLEVLKSREFLDSTRKGHFLSGKGEKALSEIFSAISPPKPVSIQNVYPDFRKIGVLVKNAPHLKESYMLRDIAVKNGADGALILKFDGDLYAPESDNREDYSELKKHFDFEGNDVLVIAFSSQRRRAENGALAIAIEMSGILQKFISELK